MPIQGQLVLDLMIFDPNNPRSLTYQLDRLKAYLRNLPKTQPAHALTEYETLALEAESLLKLADKNKLVMPDTNGSTYKELDEFLSKMHVLLSAIPNVVSKTYFKHAVTSKTIMSR
jgi:uncharacterized alpha-E superfamily protein